MKCKMPNAKCKIENPKPLTLNQIANRKSQIEDLPTAH